MRTFLKPTLPAVWLALCTASAWAQTPAAPTPPSPPTDAGRLLEEQRQQQQRPALPQTPQRVVEPPVRPTVTMPEGATVLVSDFRITGASSFAPERLAELVKPWLGRRLDINGLNEAAGAITRLYQSSGHLLTYAYLPAQRVADGTIEIAVLEGRLEGVQIVTAQDVRLRDEVIEAHTERLTTQPPLLQPEVERQMLLLNDIPGVTARAAFTPGSTTGGAEMVVSVAEDEPLVARGEVNNHGSRSTGLYRAGLSLQLRDLFGWGDSTRAYAMASNRGSLVSGYLSTLVPLGGSGFKLGASVSRLRYELQGAFQATGANGTAEAAGINASYPLLRSTDANLSVNTSYEFKRLKDESLVTLNPKRDKVFDAGLAFDLRDRWGVSAGTVTATAGNLDLLDPTAQLNDADHLVESPPGSGQLQLVRGLNTARHYRRLGAQVLRQQALWGAWSLNARLAGQLSGGNLDSSQKLGLGGPYAVRAYASGEASVDQGYVSAIELRYGFDYLGGGLTLGWFYDLAEGHINRRPLRSDGNRVLLAGTGLSVQWNAGDWGLGASLAVRTSGPATVDGDSRARLFLQLSVTP